MFGESMPNMESVTTPRHKKDKPIEVMNQEYNIEVQKDHSIDVENNQLMHLEEQRNENFAATFNPSKEGMKQNFMEKAETKPVETKPTKPGVAPVQTAALYRGFADQEISVQQTPKEEKEF